MARHWSIGVECAPWSRFQDSKRNSTQAKPGLSLEWACVRCAAPKTLPRSHPYGYLPIQTYPELRQTCKCVTEMKKRRGVGEEGDVKSASKSRCKTGYSLAPLPQYKAKPPLPLPLRPSECMYSSVPRDRDLRLSHRSTWILIIRSVHASPSPLLYLSCPLVSALV